MSDRFQTSAEDGITHELDGGLEESVEFDADSSTFDLRPGHHRDPATASPRKAPIAPELSAQITIWPWQRQALLVGSITIAIALLLDPALTTAMLFALMAIPFLFVAALRILAIGHLYRPKVTPDTHPKSLHDQRLPNYAVLVPLYNEAHVVPGLLDAMRAIDYPTDLLQISFITEAVDHDTYDALKTSDLDDHMRIIVVPDGTPRTKPRALNYALQSARGEVVTVFDAEDVPEPDQLRRAATLLASQPSSLGCIQARLNVYNPNESWLTRQFTIEYTGLFDAILPVLARLGVPVPLGGTSNHFPRHTLQQIGAWDPYNVTEDADLGIRLARFLHPVTMLPSTTWEEAPATFKVWLGQRTRWMKGFMQTYLVHMREPGRLWRELGPGSFLGFQALMAGLILSPLIHPLFYLALAVALMSGPQSPAELIAPDLIAQEPLNLSWFFWIGFINLVIGYGAAIALGALAVARRGWRALVVYALTMPVYWLLISLGAYKALWELVTDPHHWEKTDHAKSRNWVVPKMQESREKPMQ